MKLIKLLMLFMVGALFASTSASGQANASLNILTLNSGQVPVGGVVDIQVTVGNTGPTASIAANKVRAQISVPTAICTLLPNAGQTGLPPGWTITVNNGGSITVCNGSDIIPVGAQRQVFIKVQGNTIGGPSTINGSLIFSSGTSCTVPGTLAGDNTADNTATTSIQVIAAPACSIALSASAGTIACNGGSTTLTATASGSAAAIEYSLNGGAFQSGNTFTVGAGTYTVTAREVSNTSCTASAGPVTVTEPAAISASASAGSTIQCNGGSTTLTVTASGGNGTLEYSLNGGAFQSGNTFTVGAGTHTVTVRDAGGCTTTTIPVTVTQPSAVSASASVTTPIAVPGGTGTITVTASGGTGAKTYVITSGPTINTTGATSGVFTGLTAGSYSFTATDENGCTGTASATLTNPVAGPANASLNILTLNSGQVAVGSVVDIQVTVGNTGPSFIGANKVRAQISIPTAIASALPNAGQTGLPPGWTITVNNGGTITICNGSDVIPAGVQRQIFIKVQGNTVGGPSTVNGSLIFSNGTSCTVPGTLSGDNTADNTATTSIQVVPGACALAVSASAGTILCNGGTTTLTATATGATGAVEYSLNGGAFQSGNTFTVNAGSYTVTAREVANPSCSATSSSVTVSQPAELVAAESHTAILCFGGSSTVTISATGGTAPYTGTGTFTQAAGTQTYTVTDANGCTDQVTVTVSQPSAALAASATSTPVTTVGGSNGTATVTASGGTSPYTYLWTPGGQTTATATGLTAGSYSVTVTDANGCTATASTTVGSPVCNVTATATAGAAILCNGGTTTVTIAATGGTAPYTGTGTFTRGAGTFTFAVTDASGCTADASITITQPSALLAGSSATPITLPGGSSTITVTASGGTGPYTGTGTFTRTAGTYTFTVTDANGCTASTTITVSDPVPGPANASLNILTLNSGQVTIGSVVDIQVTVGNTGPSFIGANKVRAQISIPTALASALPNAGQTGLPPGWTITVNNGGTITVCNGSDIIPAGTQRQIFIKVQGNTVGGPSTINGSLIFSNGSSCTIPGTLSGDNTADNTATTSIQVVPGACTLAVSASAGTILCNGGTTTLTATATGAAGAVEYSLDGGAFQPGNTFTVNGGSHTVTAREVAVPTCTASTTVTVSQPSEVVAAESHTAILCFGGSSTVTISATGGTAPYTGTGTFTQAAGTQTYTVTDANGCTDVVTVTVSQPSEVVAAESHTAILCFGGSSTVTISATGGTAPYTGTGSFTQAAGTQTYTVTDANGCTDVVTVTVSQPSEVVAAESHTAILCFGGSSTVTISATGGTAPYTGTGTFTQAAGTQSYTVTDANGCTDVVTVTVTQPAAVAASATSTPVTTVGGSNGTATVTASGGTSPYTYLWTPGGQTTATATGLAAGSYTVTVTDANGCTATASTTVGSPACNLSATATAGAAILCNGGTTTVTIAATGGTAPYTGTGTFTRGAGTFTFTVTDASGCTADASITITQPSALLAGSSATPITLPGGSSTITVTASGGTGPYTGTGTFTRTAGTYTFTVTDANGCTATTTITVSDPVPGLANASLNILTLNSGQVTIGSVVDVQVTVGNTGPSFIGANKVRAQISIPTALASALPNAGQTGLPPGWTITVNNGGTITVCNGSDIIPAGTQRQIFIKVQGNTVGGPSTINGSLLFSNGSSCTIPGTLSGDNTADNTATTSIQVVPGACGLAVTASAGTILCHGGTTTLTATATGAAGAVEYSLDGGAFQPGNTFTVNGGSHTVTVREVATPSCSASATVTVSEPAELVAAEAHTAILCFGGSSSVTISATAGTAPYTGTGTFTQAAGTQSYTVTDANGCTDVVTVTVSQPAVLVAAETHTTITCFGDSSVVTVSATGGTAPYTGTGTFTRGAATFTFTVTDANGCTDAVTVTITEPAPVPAPIAGTVTQPTCAVATGSVELSGLPSGNWTITRTPGSVTTTGTGTSTTISGLAPGTYTFTVTNADGCTSDASGDAVINSAPGAPVAPTVNVVQPTCAVATGTITVTSSTSGLTFSLDGGAYAAYPSGGYSVAAGSHTLLAQNASGCTSAATSVTINAQPATPAAPTVNVAQPSCTVATGTITVTSSTSGLTFSLDGGAYAAYPSGGYSVAAGSHTLSARNASGCTSATTTVTVDAAPATPAASIVSVTQPTCTAAAGTITVTSSTTGLTYSLDGGVFAAYPAGGYTVATGSHTLRAQNASGCISATTNATINAQPATPSAPTVGTTTQPGCTVATGSVVLSGLPSGNWTITRSPGAVTTTGTGASTTISGLAAGTCSYTVTNAAGCTSASSANVVINAQPASPSAPIVGTITQPSACASTGSVELSGLPSGNWTITRTPGGVTTTGTTASTTISGLAAGSYTFTITNAAGCTSPASASVVISAAPAALTVSAASTPSTGGADGTATANVSGGTTPYSYLWSPGGQTTQTVAGLAAGAYTVTVTDARGCTATATTTVTTGCGVVVTAGPDQEICPGSSVILTAGVTGGSVSSAAGPQPFAEVSGSISDKRIYSGNIDYITIGNTFSQHEARVNCNKNATSSKTLTIPVGASVKKAFLFWSGSGSVDNTVKLNGVTVTAENTKTDNISGVGAFFGARKDVTSMVTGSGTYTVSDLTWSNASSYCNWNGAYGAWGLVVVYEQSALPATRIHVNSEKFDMTYPAGTYSTTINNISVPANCTPNAKLTIIAFEGDNYKGENLRISNVLDADSNNFRGQAGPNLDIITKNAPSIISGTTSLTYSIQSYQTQTIYGPAIEALFDYVKVLKYNSCPAGSCNDYKYEWRRNGTVVGTTKSINVSTPGTYSVKATDCANCSGSDDVVISTSSLAATSTIGTPVSCNGGSTTVTVSATGGVAPYTGTGTFTKTAGTYTFTVKDAKGCSVTTSATITQPSALAATATATQVPCGGTTATVTVSATGGTAPYTGTGTFTKAAGIHTLTVTDAKGCTKTVSVTVTTASCGPVDPAKCYKLIVKHSGKAASVASSSTTNGGNVEQRSFAGSNSQVWKFELVETGYYKVINFNSGKVLDVASVNTSDGANVQQWAYAGGNNQRWSLVSAGSGYYNIKAKHSNKAMSVAGSSSSNGANVEQRGTGGSDNAKWAIMEVGCPVWTKGAPVVAEEAELELEVVAMPNPSTTDFTLAIKSGDFEAPITVRLLDGTGKLLSTMQKSANSTFKVGADKWTAGLYYAEVTQGGQRKIVKLVKVN